MKCEAIDPQENKDDIASCSNDNELLSDYVNLVENHEAMQSLVCRYMSENAKLTQELESLKGRHSEAAHKLNDYVALQASHDQLEHKLSESRSENNELANQNAKDVDELSKLRSELSDLQKRLETAQGREQKLHFKLNSFHDASETIEIIEQSFLPHGSKKGLEM